MFPHNLNWMGIMLAERVKEYATRDRDPQAEWPEIIDLIRLEMVTVIRDHCIVEPKGHEWINNYESENDYTRKLCRHCNIWQELLTTQDIPSEERLPEADTIVQVNSEFFDKMRADVALVGAKRILTTISKSAGTKVPLQDVNRVLNMPAIQNVS